MRASDISLSDLQAAVVSSAEPDWRDFALKHPSALPYHHPAWTETIVDTYGFKPFALTVRSPKGDVLGGLPFVELGGRLRGKRWVALPFTDACPPLTAPELNGGLGAVVSGAAEQAGIAAVEVRGPLGVPDAETERGVVHRLTLGEPDELFGKFGSQVRRNIRKAERSGLTLRVAELEEDLTDVYFALHADTRRRLGVPTQPRRFFAALWQRMLAADLGFALLVYREHEPIAGAVFLEWNGVVIYKFGASDARHWALRPNNLIFWEAIKRAWDSGAKVLDFGRSDFEDEGLRAFKRSWGAVEEPLVYATLGRPAQVSTGSAERLLKPVLRRSPVWVGRGLGELFYRFGA